MSRSLFKVTLVLLILAGFVGMSRAQGGEDNSIIRPSTKAGSAAWVFAFQGLSTLGMPAMNIGDPVTVGPSMVQVAGAGYKYYLSDDLALRAILGFGTSSNGDAEKGGKNTYTNYGVAVGIEMHTRAVYSTSPYFGAQLSYAGGSSKNEVTSGGTTTETSYSGSSFGIGVLAGFDWYFTHGLAVGAEYMLGFSSGSASATVAGTTTDAPSTSAIAITNNGNVHLVVHF